MLPQACRGQLQQVKEIMQLDDGPAERTAQKSAQQHTAGYASGHAGLATLPAWPDTGAALGPTRSGVSRLAVAEHHPLAPDTVVAILASQVLDIPRAWPERAETVVLAVRVPRAAAAVLVGAALSVAGATYQTCSATRWCRQRCSAWRWCGFWAGARYDHAPVCPGRPGRGV